MIPSAFSEVNDSFSHERRDVLELIEAVLSGQVHPRQIPLIRVAWHLGFWPMDWLEGKSIGFSPEI